MASKTGYVVDLPPLAYCTAGRDNLDAMMICRRAIPGELRGGNTSGVLGLNG